MTGATPKIRFAVIGAEHGHVFEIIRLLVDAGGEFASFFLAEDRPAGEFETVFSGAKRVREVDRIFEDPAINLIVSATVPNERAAIGIRAMRHGKDFAAVKPAATTLSQIAELRRVQAETGQIFSVYYSERFGSRSTIRAGELIAEGRIGNVRQTVGLGPHLLKATTRESWFFDQERYGGIICDIGSHQIDQFLYFTGSTEADIISSQTGNIAHAEYPEFEDIGEVSLRGNNGTGYFRVDWLSPTGLPTWGDTRLTILGTEGYIELRKNIDPAGRPGSDHLLLVDGSAVEYFDCSAVQIKYGESLVRDILERTETVMSQDHCFLATELALSAQSTAQKI